MIRLFRRKVLRRFGAPLAAGLISLLGATVRLRVRDERGTLHRLGPGPVIFAFWHNRILLMPYFYRKINPGRRLKVLISRSRDGDFIASVAARFGIGAVRGSSSRGAVAAVREAARELQQGGGDIGITPDGPRGPIYEVHDGLLLLARQSGAPVIPLTYHLDWKWEARSWDRFQVPLPFTRCELQIGVPIVAEGLDQEALREVLTRGLMGEEEARSHAA